MLNKLTTAVAIAALGSSLALTGCGKVNASKKVDLPAPSLANADTSLLSKGIYSDKKTGLMWMRCSIGQKWTGKTCVGKVSPMKYADSKAFLKAYNEQVTFGGFKDWRLPTIYELQSIRKCTVGHFRHKNPAKMVGGIMMKPSGGIVMESLTKSSNPKVAQRCADKPRKLRTTPDVDSTIFPGVTTKGNGYQTSTKHPKWTTNTTVRWQVGFSKGWVYGRTERNGQSFLLVRDAK